MKTGILLSFRAFCLNLYAGDSVKVIFNVKVPSYTGKNTDVFITGSVPELEN